MNAHANQNIDDLIQMLDSEDLSERVTAIRRLGEFGGGRALKVLRPPGWRT